MAETYKFTSFNLAGAVRGRTEPAKMMLAMAGENYEEVKVDRETEWPELKPSIPGGRLPCLETSEGKIVQSVAIYMYVAGKLGFVPETLYQKAQSSSILLTMNDILLYIQENLLKSVLDKDAPIPDDLPEKKQRGKDMFEQLKELVDSIKKPESKFIHGDKITVTDVVVFCIVESTKEMFPGVTGDGSLKAFMDNMRADPLVEQYLKDRE